MFKGMRYVNQYQVTQERRFIEIIYDAFIIRIKIEIKRAREELLSETIYMNELSKESCK